MISTEIISPSRLCNWMFTYNCLWIMMNVSIFRWIYNFWNVGLKLFLVDIILFYTAPNAKNANEKSSKFNNFSWKKSPWSQLKIWLLLKSKPFILGAQCFKTSSNYFLCFKNLLMAFGWLAECVEYVPGNDF